MKLTFVLLLVDEHPPHIQYVCPLCDGQTCRPAPESIDIVTCSHCGSAFDASGATLHLLTARPNRLAFPSPVTIY